MKLKDYILASVLLLLFSAVTGLWYWVVIIPFVFVVFKNSKIGSSLLFGTLTALTVWSLYALFKYFTTADIIAEKVSVMFGINNGLLLIPVTGLVAAIAGFAGALSGVFMRNALRMR